MTLCKKGRSRPRAVIRECPLWVESSRSWLMAFDPKRSLRPLAPGRLLLKNVRRLDKIDETLVSEGKVFARAPAQTETHGLWGGERHAQNARLALLSRAQ